MGDDSIAEVTSLLLVLPQQRHKCFLLLTPQTLADIYCMALNALVKMFTHIHHFSKRPVNLIWRYNSKQFELFASMGIGVQADTTFIHICLSKDLKIGNRLLYI